jgi:rhodanese-related sulfurtransferase
LKRGDSHLDYSRVASQSTYLVAFICSLVGVFRIAGFYEEDHMALSPKFLALVNEAKQRVKEISIPDVKRRMDAGRKMVLVDVREESEWAQGHLPGAIHLGRGILERDIEQQVPESGTEFILYCSGGYRSALSADNLQKMGYRNVESMVGGWQGWIEAGYPTQKD